MMKFCAAVVRIFALGALMALAGSVSAQQVYPSKSVRLIVTAPPGGGTDFAARAFGHKLSEGWGQPVLVENRPGATGMIAMDATAKAAPDGYTLIVISSADSTSSAISARNSLDLSKDFTPVAMLGTTPLALAVHPSVNASTLQEFIALAKSQPGKLHYASGGTGGGQHLATELLKREAKIDLVHVPYKGGGPGIADLLAGQVQLTLTSLPSLMPYFKTGKLRALALMSNARSSSIPDLPTFAELGLPGVNLVNFYGFLAPPRTPPAIIDRIAQSVATVARVSDFQEKMSASGLDVVVGTPADFGSFLRREQEKVRTLARDVNIRLE